MRQADAGAAGRAEQSARTFSSGAELATFGAVALGLTALAGVVLFGSPYPPSVDFPQHAVQLSAWIHYAEPQYGFTKQFEINYRTPYLLSYLLARPFASSLGVVGALKLVVLFAAIGNVAAYAALLTAVGQDVWLCLLAFPLTFGFVFYAGFLNFLLATPLVIGALAFSLRYARKPTWLGGLGLFAILAVTFSCHGLAFVLATPLAGSLVLAETRGSTRQKLQRLWPLAAAAALAAPWVLGFGARGVASKHPTQWSFDLYRALEFPSMLLSSGGIDPLAYAFGLAMLVVCGGSLAAAAWSQRRWGLYILALACYLLAPFQLLGVAFVYERFAAFVIPGAMLNSGGAAPFLAARPRRILIVSLATLWLAILIARTRTFNAETAEYDRAVASVRDCARVRPLIIDSASDAFPDLPAYLHFPAYYQAQHGGYYGYSFARYNIVLMRYRAAVDIGMAEDAEWHPERFDVRELERFDCVIARGERATEPPALGAAVALGRARLAAHVGRFWIFRTRNP